MINFQTFLSNHSGLNSAWNFVNLIVGNTRHVNRRTRENGKMIALVVITLYLLMFTVGLFAGDLVASKAIQVEKIMGILSTALIYSMGSSIIFDSFKNKCCTFPSLISATLILTQTGFVFNLFPMPIIHIFYYLASITMMIFVYVFVHNQKQAQQA